MKARIGTNSEFERVSYEIEPSMNRKNIIISQFKGNSAIPEAEIVLSKEEAEAFKTYISAVIEKMRQDEWREIEILRETGKKPVHPDQTHIEDYE